VLDNLPDPATLAAPVLPGCTPEELGCRLLITTRRHDLGRFAGVEVTVLPEEPALQLLLRYPSRRVALDPSHPDHEHARAIARMLGRLPLALELAGAYLGKFTNYVSLADYRVGLRVDGALATLDADAADLSDADVRRVHGLAIAATIAEQWDALGDEAARLVLRVAGLFPESAPVPIARLGLLAGLDNQARRGRLSILGRAVKLLEAACLVERLEDQQIRLHPLIREFALQRTPPEQADEFLRHCIDVAAGAMGDYDSLEALVRQRGVDALQGDLVAIVELCPPSASGPVTRLRSILRLLQREAHELRRADSESQPTRFAQNLHRVREPSLRHYVRAKELKAAGMGWTDALAVEDETRRAGITAELLASDAYGSTAERVKALVEQGGGCRATLFSYRRRLSGGNRTGDNPRP
jgi:hypothetical protein